MQHEPLKYRQPARRLRRQQTPAEAALWQRIRNRQFANLKFRRQHEIATAIVDFYCEDLKLAIELDGDHHFDLGVHALDAARDQKLQALGVTVLRFENEDVLHNLGIVLEHIRRVASALQRPSSGR